MKPYKAYAHIYSLDGEMDEITVLEETGNNEYPVDYRRGEMRRRRHLRFLPSGAYDI